MNLQESTTPPALHCLGLSHTFGDRLVLDRLDIDLEYGSLCVLLGPNGAGKSTALRLLTGQLRPPPGCVWLGGRDVAAGGLELKRSLGVVPEGLALFSHLSLQEHLDLLGPSFGGSTSERRRRGVALIDSLGLGSILHLPLGKASHGNRKRAALVLALLPGPRHLFLDEPFEGLDPHAAQQVLELLRNEAQQGSLVLFSSHALSLAERLATHALLLQAGRLRWSGPTSRLPGSLENLFFDQDLERLCPASAPS